MNISINTLSRLDFLQKKFVKSPLNYTGGKYKLLNQILPLFPNKINTFVDLFAGGCNVSVNVKAKSILANDINKQIVDLYQHFKNNSINDIENNIDSIINKYNLSNSSENGYEFYNTNSKDGLSSYNREGYLKLRADYNKSPTSIMFYVLVIFAFNNQIRFNKKGEFNLPVNKRDFTSNMQNHLKSFVKSIANLNIDFTSKDFRDVHIPDESFVYIDPPYLATTATYNENGGWNRTLEIELLQYLDELNNKGIKFALSNVLESKGNKNQLLIDWSKKYKINYLTVLVTKRLFSYQKCVVHIL